MGRILIADDHDALRRGLVRALTTPSRKPEARGAPNGSARRSRSCTDRGISTCCERPEDGRSDGLDVLPRKDAAPRPRSF